MPDWLRGSRGGRARRLGARTLGIDSLVVPKRPGHRPNAPDLPGRSSGFRDDAGLAPTVRPCRDRYVALGMDRRRRPRASAPRRPLDGGLRIRPARRQPTGAGASSGARRARRGAVGTLHARTPPPPPAYGPPCDSGLHAGALSGRTKDGTQNSLADIVHRRFLRPHFHVVGLEGLFIEVAANLRLYFHGGEEVIAEVCEDTVEWIGVYFVTPCPP